MQAYEEIVSLGQELRAAAYPSELQAAEPALKKLSAAIRRVEQAFSGSWLGHHSRIYYAGLVTPPPGAGFSQLWGLEEKIFDTGTVGDWREHNPEFVKAHIYALAGHPDFAPLRNAEHQSAEVFRRCKTEILSILSTELSRGPDEFLASFRKKLEGLQLQTPAEVVRHWQPRGQVLTQDLTALGQGVHVPPHVSIDAKMVSTQHTFGCCRNAADLCERIASHIRRKAGSHVRVPTGSKVFIGHGRSSCWRELKDFVADRLSLPWDEFNRVPIAGITNISRLSEMLDNAAMAFLIMTAEDELADGEIQARMNVIHEVGLFQGRLGFTRAIVLVEEGCKEFTNIQGLGQLRFPKDKISAVFEDVRAVLEREGVIAT